MATTIDVSSLPLLCDTKTACSLLTIKSKTLYDLVKRGLLRRHPSFRKLLVPRDSIVEFLKIADA